VLYGQANAHRHDDEMQIGFEGFTGDGHGRDGSHGKALHIRLDRTTINGHIHETERSMSIGYLRSRRSVPATRQRHPHAFAMKRISVSRREHHRSGHDGASAD
jgi:hypothetical protein